MAGLPWLGADPTAFPPTHRAFEEPNGLLAAGGDLSWQRLLHAYQRGIFPWYSADQPILWWTPNPRTILLPKQVHCSRSMVKWLRKCSWRVVVDQDFERVLGACAAPRAQDGGTWITAEMHEAYCELHRQGYAHSIEVYAGAELVGGLYGVALGGVFFGESMFSRASNASKLALISLARWLAGERFALIDCQVASQHLYQLGAQDMPRLQFEQILNTQITAELVQSNQPLWLYAQGKVIARDGTLAH